MIWYDMMWHDMMQHFETRAISTFPHKVKFWGRYVDDIFAIIMFSLKQQFTDHLNTQH